MTIHKWCAIQSLINLVLAVAIALLAIQAHVHQRGASELNRLQGVFNDKTIEFFTLINEHQNEQLR